MPYARSKFIHAPFLLLLDITQEQINFKDNVLQSMDEQLHTAHVFLLPRNQWWQPCLGLVTCRFCQETNIYLDLSKPISLSGKKTNGNTYLPQNEPPKIKQIQPDPSKAWSLSKSNSFGQSLWH